jgi:hypothetical protein
MARMTGKSTTLHTCVYGCCTEVGTDKKMGRRIARRRERQEFLRNLINDHYLMSNKDNDGLMGCEA